MKSAENLISDIETVEAYMKAFESEIHNVAVQCDQEITITCNLKTDTRIYNPIKINFKNRK